MSQNYNRQSSSASNRQNYRRHKGSNRGSSHRSSDPAIRSQDLSDLPGYSFDVNTGKYYKILPNRPGQPSGSTQKDIDYMNNVHYNENRTRQHQHLLPAQNQVHKSIARILPGILRDMQIGRGRCSFPAISAKKIIDEQRIRGVSNCPSYNFEVIDTMSDQFSGCQFLDVKEEGRALIGCWGVSSNGEDYPSCSQVVSYKISVDHAKAERESRLRDTGKSLLDTNGRFSSNTYGLRFETVDNCINVDSTLVDMTIAPADSDVTVMIYATAHSYVSDSYNSYKIITRCRVFLKAVDQLTKEEGKDSMSSPIYNAEWITSEHIWSCAFDSNHMRVGVGMENCAAVFDVLNESKFKVSSGGKNVIAQQYSKEGDILYLGRRNANISSLDLRMSNNHTVGEFPDSNSTCFIHRMENRPNQILTDNFNGKLKLWDNRTRSCVLQFDGHRNSSHKVPCFVDASERFVFAVGEDAIARGWSLGSGELLCSIDCPRSLQANSDFPRLVYSDRWGGLNGNSAIILAGLKGDLSVHELPMI